MIDIYETVGCRVCGRRALRWGTQLCLTEHAILYREWKEHHGLRGDLVARFVEEMFPEVLAPVDAARVF